MELFPTRNGVIERISNFTYPSAKTQAPQSVKSATPISTP